MFLPFVQQKNPALLDYAGHLMATGSIQPDSYVLDLDAIEANAGRLAALAASSGVTLYFMSKQVGRNPEVARRVLAQGFAGMVAVDFREALSLHAAGLPVRHIGHLVQVPEGLIDAILDLRPEVITVYSLEKAAAIARKAAARGLTQDLLLRVAGPGDVQFPGQEGGILIGDLARVSAAIGRMEGVRLAGVTAFPCFQYDPRAGRAEATRNASTLLEAAALLGGACRQINMPSCNSLATIPMIAALGGTHAEPGHSLTGTNPDNPGEADPLVPAMVYATEVSHQFAGESLCYGGGYYRRSNLSRALVLGPDGYRESAVREPDCASIDYHFRLPGRFPVGAPVLMAFRTQIFVTRSRVVLVEGLASGRPRLAGSWDSQGNALSGRLAL